MIHRKNGDEAVIVDYKSNPSNKEMNEKSFALSVKTYYGLQTACYWMAFQTLYGKEPQSVGESKQLIRRCGLRTSKVESNIHLS